MGLSRAGTIAMTAMAVVVASTINTTEARLAPSLV
jgi:hypothetical protein